MTNLHLNSKVINEVKMSNPSIQLEISAEAGLYLCEFSYFTRYFENMFLIYHLHHNLPVTSYRTALIYAVHLRYFSMSLPLTNLILWTN